MSDDTLANPSAAANTPLPVVAGFDGSEVAGEAVLLAAEEAVLRGVALRLVYAFSWPWIYPPLIDGSGATEPDPRVHALRLVTQRADQLRAQYQGLDVAGRVIDGHAATVLVELSQAAGLLVVGHRGAGGFGELLAGSTAIHTAAHAHCPVIVSRGGPPNPTAPVMVGVDASPNAHAAALFAYDLAARRRVPLAVISVLPIHATQSDALAAAGYPPPSTPDLLRETLADCVRAYPGVEAHVQVVHDGSAAAALVRAAERAGMAVVGSRGLSGLRGMLLGSVGRALIEHSPCPVAVVHGTHQ